MTLHSNGLQPPHLGHPHCPSKGLRAHMQSCNNSNLHPARRPAGATLDCLFKLRGARAPPSAHPAHPKVQ
eukprot:CAMPEP_0202860576 /NCGR_PEP_ID=MMETSP1391-20130828/2236_1 /ASSEMBLY_ACC=CAM_ASM_000867 /TAXON_ID=1034604 /ORGANISM="Chlamydomonas leiostraca, Strain SAG 11-49" /LENGTH=69 /DNA_ID=CAMNT_0049539771 /DNA_START=132 /DNA_END=338 /DNA_ORIENTATION=+